MTPQSAKAKGRKFQQKVRDKIITAFRLNAEDVRSTSMGAGGEDIQLSPYARQLFPYSVECKKNKSFAIYKQYEQAQANCPSVPSPTGETVEPILFIEGDHKKPLVVLDMNHFFALLKYMNKLEEEGE